MAVARSSTVWQVDFDRTPFLVIWETTQACDLACKHCRASAIPGPIPGELSTAEGMRLIDQVVGLGTPLLVLSGGDAATRPDLFDLIRHGKEKGLRVATIPAATPRLTEDLIRKLKDAGLDQVAFSLDFPTAQQHDSFRGSPGAFDLTMRAIEWAHKHGVPPQINTCLWGESAGHLPEMAGLVERLKIVFWEVFFLVPVGRGTGIAGMSAARCEEMFPILAQAQKRNDFILKVTEAPHYRRWLAQKHDHEHGRGAHVPTGEPVPLAHRGVNAGSGFVFVSHVGEVYPSGFLPVSGGNVRRNALADVYRDADLFRSLRDPDRLKGRCGRCPFKRMCGGSRSRAYAMTGDWLETDPWCSYEPGGEA
ncbi:MAG: TIGR04053 family radical SAM/SPASM domain-containing protein [Planctomycetes bacterium]|nr:TIGR04053 family radical SAM/SPASM domain-containing protein [Planctomycetota bacterium]